MDIKLQSTGTCTNSSGVIVRASPFYLWVLFPLRTHDTYVKRVSQDSAESPVSSHCRFRRCLYGFRYQGRPTTQNNFIASLYDKNDKNTTRGHTAFLPYCTCLCLKSCPRKPRQTVDMDKFCPLLQGYPLSQTE